MSEHSILSPSSSGRWIQCPASVRLSGEAQQLESSYASEGTIAHALAELKGSLAFGKITKRQYTLRRNRWRAENEVSAETEAEMDLHTDAYVELLQARVAVYPNSQVMLEQRLDSGIPECKGTSDAVIVSPRHVEIVDFKYGAGIPVSAEQNSQLRLYALGALDTYGDLLGETERVYMTIHQPRLSRTMTAETTPDDLRRWRVAILSVAEEALAPGARFGPSESACRFCPVAGRCPAQTEVVTRQTFAPEPALMEPEEMARILERLPEIKSWLKSFEEAALNVAYSEGKTIPGYKVILSGGRRVVTEQEAAIAALLDAGFTFEEVAKRTIRGIGELEKVLGPKRFETLLGSFVEKTPGRPSLVPTADRRPAISPEVTAREVFTQLDPAPTTTNNPKEGSNA